MKKQWMKKVNEKGMRKNWERNEKKLRKTRSGEGYINNFETWKIMTEKGMRKNWEKIEKKLRKNWEKIEKKLRKNWYTEWTTTGNGTE